MPNSVGRARASLVAAGSAIALCVSALLPSSAVAAEDEGYTSPLTLKITVDSPRATFKAGETIVTTFSATNTTDEVLTVPEEAALRIWATRHILASEKDQNRMSANCEGWGMGWGEDDWTESQGYLLRLPTSIAVGQSFTCTLTQTMTAKDVELGGTWGTLHYSRNPNGDSSRDFWWYKYASDGKSPAPTIQGLLKLGGTLSVSLGYWARWDEFFTFQWRRDGVAISGATNPTYTVTASDAGAKISVYIRGYSEHGEWIGQTTSEIAGVARDLRAGTPTISGVAAVGRKLTAKPGTWTSGTKLTYEWFANGKPISKATKASLTLSAAQRGKKVSVTVTGSKTGFTAATKTSKATSAVRAGTLTAPTPKIAGTGKAGSKLTAKPGEWTTGTKLSYRWLVSGKSVAGATKSTFTVKSSYRGKSITVKVTGKKAGFSTVTKTSSPKKGR